MSPKYIYSAALFLTFLFCDDAIGQAIRKEILFDHYGAPQGFAGSQALCLNKANDGFLWIGTERGLLRYDGHRFKTYRSNPFDSTTISSNYIKHMVEDKYGRLWLSSSPGLNLFDPKTGINKRVVAPFFITQGKNLDVYCFRYDKHNDVMWLGTDRGLLYSQGKEVKLNKVYIHGLEGKDIFNSVQIGIDGIFWLTNTFGLHRYDPSTCKYQTFHRPGEDPGVPNDDGFTSSYLATDGLLWLGNWTYGLMLFDTRTYEASNFTFFDPKKVQNGVFSISPSYIPGEENLLWLATSDGVKTFDILKHTFNSYSTNDLNSIKGVAGLGFCFEPTTTEGMWIGTYKGLHRYDAFKQNVQYIDIHLPGSQKYWQLTDVCFERDSNKDSIIWFGIPYVSIFRFDLVNKKIVPIPAVLQEYCNNVGPSTLFVDSKNILWISSYLKGLIGYDLTSKKLLIPSFKFEQKEKPNILNIEEDAGSNLWLGATNGIFFYNRKRNELSEQQDISQFLDQNKLSKISYTFTIDEKQSLWATVINTLDKSNGLLNFDPQSKKIKLFTQQDYPDLTIMNVLEGIKSIGDDKLIVTSFNGFSIVNTASKSLTFELFETYNGKPFGGLQTISVDKSKQVWMSTDDGVILFDPLTKSISNFTHYNSLIGLLPHPDLAFSSKTNTLYIGQNSALNKINTGSLMVPKSGEVILSDLNISNYKMVSVPSNGQTIELAYNQNSIDLEFTNLNFTNSLNNTYQYTLDVGNDTWKNMSSNKLTFNNLGYGNYKLRVRGENSFGVKSPSEFILYLDISPPFWRSWWFNLLVLSIISFFIYRLFRYREIQRSKLDKLKHSIARDLHDDMGSTLSHIRMMSEREAMKGGSNQSFKTIADKTAEVMSNMTEIIWSINPVNDSLINIIGKIQEFAIDTLEPIGIDVFFDIDNVPEKMKLNAEDRRHLFLIFKEAINNTAKYSKATRSNFSFKIENKRIAITFDDNGTGFDPLMIKRGNGLKNMETRATALNAKIAIKTDGDGTSISLSL